jgi:thiol:disulfide interchange protein
MWVDYENGMGAARQQRKPVMIDFMAAWCGWCKVLDAEVYSNPEVIALSEQFVCIKVDGDRQRGPLQTHRVNSYPTVLFLDSDGRELHRVVGFRPTQAFMSEMRKALAARG